jgi:hypothetical protein
VSIFISKANPDYDPLIDNVAIWLLEIDNDDKRPNREIGIDKNGKPILIMPWRDNYGYWCDNEITYDYFKENFKAVDIDKIDFNTQWDTFVKQNSIAENYEFDKRGFSKYYRYLEQNGWQYDGAMSFTKGNQRLFFDSSNVFYIERLNTQNRKEFQCKNLAHFADIIENNTSKRDEKGST